MMRMYAIAGLAFTLPLMAGFAAEARDDAAAKGGGIVCNNEFQVVEGQQIESPYCEDKYLAKVAREHGENVRGRNLRSSDALKGETCRLVEADDRANEICGDTEAQD
jgi:hypothetical protein